MFSQYGMNYAFMMAFFATILTWSALVPLILPAGLLYFVSRHLLDRYMLIYVRPRTFDSDGSMLWYSSLLLPPPPQTHLLIKRVVLKGLLFTVTLSQAVVAAFLFLHGTTMQFLTASIIPFLAALWYLFSCLSGISFFRFELEPKEFTSLHTHTAGTHIFRNTYRHKYLLGSKSGAASTNSSIPKGNHVGVTTEEVSSTRT